MKWQIHFTCMLKKSNSHKRNSWVFCHMLQTIYAAIPLHVNTGNRLNWKITKLNKNPFKSYHTTCYYSNVCCYFSENSSKIQINIILNTFLIFQKSSKINLPIRVSLRWFKTRLRTIVCLENTGEGNVHLGHCVYT